MRLLIYLPDLFKPLPRENNSRGLQYFDLSVKCQGIVTNSRKDRDRK